jgi:hypothetical protein
MSIEVSQMDTAGRLMVAIKRIEILREALENARRDIFMMAPKRGSRSPLRKVAEAAAERIEHALAKTE